MRILASLFLLFVFLSGQVNLAMATHFCGNQFVAGAVGLNPKAHACCESAGDLPNDCCEDRLARSDADEYFSKSDAKANVSAVLLAPLFFIVYGEVFFKDVILFPTSPGDPEVPIPDLQVLYQRFLI